MILLLLLGFLAFELGAIAYERRRQRLALWARDEWLADEWIEQLRDSK